MKNSREALEEALEAAEEQGAGSASTKTRRMLPEALDRVGQGLPGMAQVQASSYPGLLNRWDYARDARKALITSLDVAVKLAEDEARVITSAGVQEVHTLGDEYLPEGVERSRRVCMPEAMFSTRRTRDGKRRVDSNSAIVAGGTLGLGVGLAMRKEMLTFLDLLDAPHQFWVYLCDGKKGRSRKEQALSVSRPSPSAWSRRSAGSPSACADSSRASCTSLMCSPTSRRVLYPRTSSSAPHTVGRRIHHSLVDPAGGSKPQEELFVNVCPRGASRAQDSQGASPCIVGFEGTLPRCEGRTFARGAGCRRDGASDHSCQGVVRCGRAKDGRDPQPYWPTTLVVVIRLCGFRQTFVSLRS